MSTSKCEAWFISRWLHPNINSREKGVHDARRIPHRHNAAATSTTSINANEWTFHQNRRDFLKTTVGALAAAPLMPHMVLNSALAQLHRATLQHRADSGGHPARRRE